MTIRKSQIKTIGIFGAARGCGVTHTALALSNYASAGCMYRTAYVEMNSYGTIHQLAKGKEPVFSYHQIDIYASCNRDQIPVLLNEGYDKVIFDFGIEYLKFRKEIMCCDQKVSMLTYQVWNREECQTMLNDLKHPQWGKCQTVFASVMMPDHIAEELENREQISIIQMPYFQDPFLLKEEDLQPLERILEESATCNKRKRLIWRPKWNL